MDPQTPQSKSTPSGTKVYTVIVRGECFELYHDQITFDSPNYFTACFLSGFAESDEGILRLSRNPTLFSLIVEYLSGYPILPLSAQAIPSTTGMDLASAHRCLLADARFFGLQRLCELFENRSPEMDLRWTGYANEMVNLHDVVKGKLPAGIVQRDDGTLTSASSDLPPLVFAKDVVFTLLWNTATRVEIAEQALCSRRSKTDPYLALSLRLTSPSTTTTPSTDITLSLNLSPDPSPSAVMSNRSSGTYEPFSKAITREHYWEQRDGRPVQDARHVCIDGKLRDFDSISALEHVPGDEGTRVRLLGTFSEGVEGGRTFQWREISLVWWADEVLFRLIPRGHRVGPSTPEDALAVDLVCARLRTRQNVLQNLRVREMGDEGGDYSI